MKLEHRDYDCVDPAGMVADPANYARVHQMFGSGNNARHTVGAWRWPLLHEDRIGSKLVEWLLAADTAIDYGGAAGPLGYGSLVVDRIGDVRGLEEVEGRVDLIFTAHTLEHVADLGLAMCSFHWKLNPGGRLIALVPSYTNEMLRAENWAYHAQTFCLSTDQDAPSEYTRIDEVFARHRFRPVLCAEGFNNIIVFGERE